MILGVDDVLCWSSFLWAILCVIFIGIVTYVAWIYNFSSFMDAVKKAGFLFGVTCTTCYLLFLFYPSEYCQIKRIQYSFQKEPVFETPECFIDTHKIKIMTDILNNVGGMYHMLQGVHGCGKTTVLQQASLRTKRDVVYISVPQYSDIGLALAKAFSVDMNCETDNRVELSLTYIGIKRRDCPGTTKEKLLVWEDFMLKALLQMRRDGIPAPVLILDHTNRLLRKNYKEGLEILEMLQQFAKYLADDRLLTIIFASSEGDVYRILSENSEFSRLSNIMFNSWELPTEDAISYFKCLTKETPLPDTVNDKIIDIVGGHFIHIIAVKHKLQELKWEDDDYDLLVQNIREHLFQFVISQLKKLHISIIPTYNTMDLMSNVTWELAKKLITSKSNQISMKEARQIMNPLKEQDEKLVDANIFFFDEIHAVVSFEWKLVQTYFKTYMYELLAE